MTPKINLLKNLNAELRLQVVKSELIQGLDIIKQCFSITYDYITTVTTQQVKKRITRKNFINFSRNRPFSML